MIERAGILYHPYKQEAKILAGEVAAWLSGAGVQVVSSPGRDYDDWEHPLAEQMATLSLLVVLGGDGSTLRAAHLAAPHGVPIFGINLGRIGFLSEAEPENWRERLGRVLAGRWWLEERIMLRAAHLRGDAITAEYNILNDAVIGRGGHAHVVRLRLLVDGDYVTTYTADGLIIATPTGSTAYAMAAGGPLLWPRLPNFLVIPVAAHLSLSRAVVLHQSAVVTVMVEPGYEAVLTADGRPPVMVQEGDRVRIQKHEQACLFARTGRSSYFYHRLMERFGFWHPRPTLETEE